MKKNFKHLEKNGRIYIMRWIDDGVLFGPDWESIASFDKNPPNLERCKTITRLLNECDKHTKKSDNDNR